MEATDLDFKRKVKKKLKKMIANVLQPRGFTVDGIKPAGYYISPHELDYKKKGFNNLREFYQNKWNVAVQPQCDHYVERFFQSRLSGQEAVLEIGAGVGFLTHSLLNAFPKLKYHSFELDKNLKHYLSEEFSPYDFTSYECFGNDLNRIQDNTMDVVVAYGIFTYVNFSNILQYFNEIARVCKKNSLLFFDIFDTDQLTLPLCQLFEEYSLRGDNRPFISTKLLIKILEKRGFMLVDSFQEEGTAGEKLEYYSHKLLFSRQSF